MFRLLIFVDVKDQVFQVIDIDKACSLWVVFRPYLDKPLDLILIWVEIEQVILAQESVDDNRNEQIEEDLAYNNLVQDHEDNGHQRVTTS